MQWDVPVTSELPPIVCWRDCWDVTEQYGKTCGVTLLCARNAARCKYGVICTFDNKEWQLVYWGKITDGRIIFRNMMTGNCYLAAVYEKDLIISVNNPFTLYENGNVRFICMTAQRQGYEPQYIKALGVQFEVRKPRFSVTFWMFVVCLKLQFKGI